LLELAVMWRGRSRTTSRTHLVVDAARAGFDHVGDARVHLLRREAARRDHRQVDELARRRESVEGVRAGREIVLDDPLPRHAGHLLLDPLRPHVFVLV
jgi:hypothetical protein